MECCSFSRRLRLATRSLRAPVTKQPLEGELRVVLGRQRLVRRLPGEVVFVGAGVAGIAFAGLAHHVAGELERGEAREMADLVGHHLVDGHAGLDVRARGLLDAHAGEEGAAGARVIARAIGPGLRADVGEARDDLEWLRTLASGASVGDSAKSAPPSPAGHQAAGMAPFGT